LKSYIKQRGFVASGKLLSSINFTVNDKDMYNVDINLKSLEYIQYLDKGKLLNDFMELNEVTNLVEEYVSLKIENDLLSSLD
jgi:hypothetical protein